MQSSHHSTDTGTVKRATLIGGIIVAAFVYLLIRILMLQTVGYEKYRDKVLNQITTEAEVVADRGKIYDRNGVLLATNVTTYRVFIAPRIISQVSEEQELKYDVLIATELADILGVEYDYILKQTTYTKYLDRTLARNVSEELAILCGKLSALGLNTEIETNGSVPVEGFLGRCKENGCRPSLTMDYKLPSSGMEQKMCTENLSLLNDTDTLKFVCGSMNDLDRAAEILEKFRPECAVYLSPVFGRIEPAEMVEFMKKRKLGEVRLQLQLHKIIWDPMERGV